MAFRVPYLILANSAQELQRGKINILGTFDRLWVDDLPGLLDEMTIVALVTCDHEDDLGRQNLTLRLMRPNRQSAGEFTGTVHFKPEGGSWFASQRIIANLRNVPIRETGKHMVQLLVGDTVLAEHPLTVAPRQGS